MTDYEKALMEECNVYTIRPVHFPDVAVLPESVRKPKKPQSPYAKFDKFHCKKK